MSPLPRMSNNELHWHVSRCLDGHEYGYFTCRWELWMDFVRGFQLTMFP